MTTNLQQISDSRTLRGLALAALVLVCLSSTGCVRRRMTIRSFPAGAQVFVDDQEIGTTPCSTSFVYYGKRKVMLVKDGYKTENLIHEFKVPWYEYVPLDFINENLNPNEIRDERVVDVTLSPQENVPPERLLERANSLRNGARVGSVTALPQVPPPAAVLPKIGVPGQGLPGAQPIPYQSLPGPSAPSAPFPANSPLGPPASTLTPQNLAPQNFGPQSLAPQGLLPQGAAPQNTAPQGPTSNFGQPGFGPPPLANPNPPSGAVPAPGSPSTFYPNRGY